MKDGSGGLNCLHTPKIFFFCDSNVTRTGGLKNPNLFILKQNKAWQSRFW